MICSKGHHVIWARCGDNPPYCQECRDENTAAEERARIVAMLREEADWWLLQVGDPERTRVRCAELRRMADRIERGE